MRLKANHERGHAAAGQSSQWTQTMLCRTAVIVVWIQSSGLSFARTSSCPSTINSCGRRAVRVD